MQNIKLKQLKIKIIETFKNDEKLTTTIEAVNDEDVINKAYLNEKLSKKEGHLSFEEKDYTEFKILTNNLWKKSLFKEL